MPKYLQDIGVAVIIARNLKRCKFSLVPNEILKHNKISERQNRQRKKDRTGKRKRQNTQRKKTEQAEEERQSAQDFNQ